VRTIKEETKSVEGESSKTIKFGAENEMTIKRITIPWLDKMETLTILNSFKLSKQQ
jgi:hypothetical protein